MTAKYTLYKSDISYFSGKLEAYLRYKEIPHKLVDCNQQTVQMIASKTGTQKMPAIEMDSGQWLYDTTPTMQWLDKKHPHAPTLPDDPALRFIALLVEDYGDEWLWRPAMWWRWVPKASRVALGRRIAGEMVSKYVAIPLGFYFGRRQLNEWLWKDGVNRDNVDHIRDMLYRELEFLEALFAEQPFLLGSHPSVADFGYFGSMFRHFGNDPISAEVVRREGPNTYEWLARLWNSGHAKLSPSIEWRWPQADYWRPLLARIAEDYLPYLHQNAKAFCSGEKRFDFSGKSFSLPGTVTTHYRVYCREQLQYEFNQLDVENKAKVEETFAHAGGLGSLHQDGVIESGMAQQFQLPISPAEVKFSPTLRQRIFGQPRN